MKNHLVKIDTKSALVEIYFVHHLTLLLAGDSKPRDREGLDQGPKGSKQSLSELAATLTISKGGLQLPPHPGPALKLFPVGTYLDLRPSCP